MIVHLLLWHDMDYVFRTVLSLQLGHICLIGIAFLGIISNAFLSKGLNVQVEDPQMANR